MTYQAEIVDQWVNTGGIVAPSVHGRVLAWYDATGQQSVIPPVNALVVAVMCSADQLDALEADPVVTVLWSEEAPDEAS